MQREPRSTALHITHFSVLKIAVSDWSLALSLCSLLRINLNFDENKFTKFFCLMFCILKFCLRSLSEHIFLQFMPLIVLPATFRCLSHQMYTCLNRNTALSLLRIESQFFLNIVPNNPSFPPLSCGALFNRC